MYMYAIKGAIGRSHYEFVQQLPPVLLGQVQRRLASASGVSGRWYSQMSSLHSFFLSACTRVPGRVAPRDCSPGAPTDPYVPSRAYGSSRHEHATGRHEVRHAPGLAIRCCFVSTVKGFDAPAMFPSNGVMTWRPLLSTGSLGMVPPLPRYYGTLRLPAARLDPFDIFTS